MSRSSNLRTLVRQRLLDEMIKGTEQKSKMEEWSVMVVDDDALKIIASACKLTDLLSTKVTLIESLNLLRQPFPQMSAIYFMTPTEASIRRMMQDFGEGEKLYQKRRKVYKEAFLYFTAKVPNKLMNMMARSPMAQYVKGFVELNLAFQAIERFTFSLDWTPAGIDLTQYEANDLYYLYSPKVDDEARMNYCNMLGERLATFFITLGHMPLIRYNSKSTNAKQVASQTEAVLDSLRNKASQMELNDNNQTVCLILSRDVDLISPLLHDIHYGAQLYDLLDIRMDNVGTYEYKSKVHQIVLNENDPLFVKYRQESVYKLSDMIKKDDNDIKEDAKSCDQNTGRSLHKLPEMRKKKDMILAHKALFNSLHRWRDQNNINQIIELEQNIVTGVDSYNESLKASAINRLLGPQISRTLDDKMDQFIVKRLALLACLMNPSNSDTIIRQANVPNMDKSYANMSHLYPTQKSTIKNWFKKTFGKDPVILPNASNFKYDRYYLRIRYYAEQLLRNGLSESKFPYSSKGNITFPTSDASSARASTSNKKKPKFSKKRSLRASSTTSASTDNTPESDEHGIPTTDSPQRPYRLVVFVLGGITHSESRLGTILSQTHRNVDVYIGGTDRLTPNSFIRKVDRINRPETYENKRRYSDDMLDEQSFDDEEV